jgi:hypothetical protein
MMNAKVVATRPTGGKHRANIILAIRKLTLGEAQNKAI